MRTPEEDVTVAEDAVTEETVDGIEEKRRELRESEGMTDSGIEEEQPDDDERKPRKQYDGIADITSGFVKKTAHFLYNFIDIFVGVCFVIMAFLVIFAYRDYGVSYRDFAFVNWLQLVAMLFGGSMLIFNPRRTFNTSIGIYAIIMGCISFGNNWPALSEPLFNGMDPDSFLGAIVTLLDDVYFVVMLVMLGLSINLMVSGLSYLRGRPRGTVGMMSKAFFLLSVNLMMLLINFRLGVYKTFGEAFLDDPVSIIQIVMFVIFLNMMDTEEARRYNTKTRLKTSTEALRQSKTLDGKSFIHFKDAEVLCSSTFEGWDRPDDGGPAEFEYRFTIHSTGGSSFVTVQRWKGHDKYYLTITDHERGSNIRATRMAVDGMALSDDLMTFRIIGTDHFSIDMGVRHPLESYEIAWGRKA